ncbi:ERF family protein [Streptomyces sp. NPDC090054]|uniref:ERF family protein n=1 Tax=Streptomyces sp. NPDC090054 TaxID=3365933 RepID=UPI003809EB1D
MGLRANAAAAAGRTLADTQDDGLRLPEEFVNEFPASDPMAGYEPGDDDPEMVPVHLAWLRVRKEIRAIAKGEQYNGGGTRFSFRGVDTVVNTFGPVTLRHGINVLPVHVEASYRDTTTSKGNKMHECTATVTWRIIGPKGDDFTLQTQGEALDSADKATAKAQSVALRVLLLTSGLTPTHDKDPDASYIERGTSAPARSADSYRDEILDKKTSQGRLQQIGYELGNLRMMGAKVVNEVGEQETLDSLGRRIYGERAGGAQ